jgi:hypothetical protein
MEKRGTVGDLVCGQICLSGGLLICIAARPRGLATNNGISYYGTLWQTFVPYAVALLGSAFFTRRALLAIAPAVPASRPGPRLDLRRTANLLAVLLLAIAVTPYSLGLLFDWVHTVVSTVLFLLQLILAIQLIRWTDGGAPSLCLFFAQLTGALIAARYVLPRHGFLLHGQVLFELAFGGLLIRSATLLQSPRTEPDPVR